MTTGTATRRATRSRAQAQVVVHERLAPVALTAYADVEAVDLFAGSGGWDLAALQHQVDTVGIESNRYACETRRAAGLKTIEGDVRLYGPADFPNARGLIASPPCQTFSSAGKGAGRRALDAVLSLVSRLAAREPIDTSVLDDDRTGLVLEPLRWAIEAFDLHRPFEWIVLEQVPPVLPVWQVIGAVLKSMGYSVAVGNLQAEMYGVPQTRKRAILIARLNAPAVLPTPTHSRFHSRTPDKLDPGMRKWVSMAEAIGWGMTRRPYPALAAGTEGGGTDPQMLGGSGARKTVNDERYAGFWINKQHDDGPETWARPFGWPHVEYVSGNQAHSTRRTTDQPAPTVHFGARVNAVSWQLVGPDPRPAGPNDVPANKQDGSRVSVNEAAVLQSFPCNFPWRGGKSAQYQQVGNAIPPLLAAAILTCATQARVVPAAAPEPVADVAAQAEQLSLFDLENGAA